MAYEPHLTQRDKPTASWESIHAAGILADAVSSAFSVHPDAVRGPRRGGKATAFARQVAMYLTHTRLGLSYTAVGALFGRDRTTAAHACRAVEDRREDVSIDAVVGCVERMVDQLPGFQRRSGDDN